MVDSACLNDRTGFVTGSNTRNIEQMRLDQIDYDRSVTDRHNGSTLKVEMINDEEEEIAISMDSSRVFKFKKSEIESTIWQQLKTFY